MKKQIHGTDGHGRASHSRRELPASQLDTRLTRRQREVLYLLASGLNNRQIAEQLGLSLHTVESHLHNIYGKLELTNRGAAIRFAIDHGIA